MQNIDQLKRTFAFSFGGFFIWMIVGVFIGQYVNKFVQSVYFIGTLGLALFFAFFYFRSKFSFMAQQSPRKEDKQNMAQQKPEIRWKL